MPRFQRSRVCRAVFLFLMGAALPARAAEPALTVRFTGEPSCASSSCHGGGTGKEQCLIWEKQDVHPRAPGILTVARSLRIAENLGLTEPAKDTRCTVCHNPLQPLPATRFVDAERKPEARDAGVSCESCHGPAESWLRYHTRPELTHAQRMAGGMREMRGLYDRANVCVACHLNIDPQLTHAGHPEMFFELDGQMAAEPPHWKERAPDPWQGPRAWLTGQAVDLRELAWKLASRPADPEQSSRVKALAWLLSQTQAGAKALSAAGASAPEALQKAADHLGRQANDQAWSADTNAALLRKLAGSSGAFRDGAAPADELRRRAEVLVLAIDRLWTARRANGGKDLPNFEVALRISGDESRRQEAFDPAKFAGALEQLEVALELGK